MYVGKYHFPSYFHLFSLDKLYRLHVGRPFSCKQFTPFPKFFSSILPFSNSYQSGDAIPKFSQLFSSILPLSSSTGYMPSGHDITNYLICLGKHNLPLFSPYIALQIIYHQADCVGKHHFPSYVHLFSLILSFLQLYRLHVIRLCGCQLPP